MDSNDYPRFEKAFTDMRSAIGKGDEMPHPYAQLLGDFTIDHICGSMTEWMTISKWMPAPKDLIDLCECRRSVAREAEKPTEEPHWRKNRYKCIRCRDMGYVTIWHSEAAMDAVKYTHGTGSIGGIRRITASCFCPCDHGRNIHDFQLEANEKRRHKRDIPVVWEPETNHVLCESNGGPEDVKRLVTWAEARKLRVSATRDSYGAVAREWTPF